MIHETMQAWITNPLIRGGVLAAVGIIGIGAVLIVGKLRRRALAAAVVRFNAEWLAAYNLLVKGVDCGRRADLDAALAEMDRLITRRRAHVIYIGPRLLALGAYLLKRGRMANSLHLIEAAEKYLNAALRHMPPGTSGRLPAEYARAALAEATKARKKLENWCGNLIPV